jgi:hypothetical protein
MSALIAALVLLAQAPAAAPPAHAPPPAARPAEPARPPIPVLQAQELRRFKAAEAGQGRAVDARHFYAIVNSRIGKYDKRTGAKVGEWSGERFFFPHLNSCAVFNAELVCAHSNFPAVPMVSSIETFDPAAMTHKRSLSLGPEYGSLTWLDRRDGFWWAGYANYDERGGEPGRDHRFGPVVKFDDRFQRVEAWIFPETVLARFKPTATSGGAWGEDGLLYVTGHDAKEVYVLRLPPAGSVLVHVATINVGFAGQAFAFDRSDPGVIWSIDRPTREVVVTRLPPIPRSLITRN